MAHVQVEATSKPVKAAQALTVMGGLVAVGIGFAHGGEKGLMIGAIGAGVTVALLIVLRIVAWWQTG